MPVREDFVGNRFLRLLPVDASTSSSSSSSSQSCLASPRPCPGYVQNKPAGKSKIQLNHSKTSTEQIQKGIWTNPTLQPDKSKNSSDQIRKQLSDKEISAWYRNGRKGFLRRLVGWLYSVCCHFPPISPTMKPWLVSHVIKTCSQS